MITGYDISEFCKDAQLLSNGTLSDLRKALDNYPYYQPLHYLLLKNLLVIQSSEFDSQLNASILHISDRAKLFEFLYNTQNLKETTLSTSVRRDEKDSMLENISEILKLQLRQKSDPILEEGILLPDIDFEFDIKSNIYTKSEDVKVIENIGIVDSETTIIDDIEMVQDLKESPIAEEYPQPSAIVKEIVNEEPFKQLDSQLIENTEELKPRRRIPSYFDINELAGDDYSVEKGKDDLIGKFLIENPRLVPTEAVNNEDISEAGTKEHEDFMTESLAKIFLKQGNFEKALLIYDKLSLKYPEKNSYFAARVEEINKLKNNL